MTKIPLRRYYGLANKFRNEGIEMFIQSGVRHSKRYKGNILKYFELTKRKTKVKRIFIGISFEFLVKALFIKKKFLIYETKKPIKVNEFRENWDLDNTLRFYTLIENIDLVLLNKSKEQIENTKKFLHKVRRWRNEEIHTVPHYFNWDSGEDIELIDYFNEFLRLTEDKNSKRKIRFCIRK